MLYKFLPYKRLWAILLSTLSIDQLSKLWVALFLPLDVYHTPPITLIPNFFYLIHTHNTGAAFSSFQNQSLFLALIALASISSIFLFRKSLMLKSPPLQTIFGLFIGGALGNFIDRLTRGYVIDFLDFHFGPYRFPTFNVADSAICISVALYLLLSFKNSPSSS